MWRSSEETFNLDWLAAGWLAEGPEFEDLSEALRVLIKNWLVSRKEPPYFVRVQQELNNEHTPVSLILVRLKVTCP